MSGSEIEKYLTDRLGKQLSWFDTKAIQNQGRYKILKSVAIFANLLTTMAIAVVFAVPEAYKVGFGIAALICSTMVLGTYQWEEFYNYGARWEKFRLVAERLKSEKALFLNHAGPYISDCDKENGHRLVETVEGIIRGTDLSYFTLMVEPGRRIEKRLDQPKEEG